MAGTNKRGGREDQNGDPPGRAPRTAAHTRGALERASYKSELQSKGKGTEAEKDRIK